MKIWYHPRPLCNNQTIAQSQKIVINYKYRYLAKKILDYRYNYIVRKVLDYRYNCHFRIVLDYNYIHNYFSKM